MRARPSEDGVGLDKTPFTVRKEPRHPLYTFDCCWFCGVDILRAEIKRAVGKTTIPYRDCARDAETNPDATAYELNEKTPEGARLRGRMAIADYQRMGRLGRRRRRLRKGIAARGLRVLFARETTSTLRNLEASHAPFPHDHGDKLASHPRPAERRRRRVDKPGAEQGFPHDSRANSTGSTPQARTPCTTITAADLRR